MGTFPACVVLPAGGVCPWWRRGLLKLSQVGKCWQAGKCWERYRGRRCWGFFFSENNGRTAVAILDNSYIKCYNKRSNDNKNVISHQTGKFAL